MKKMNKYNDLDMFFGNLMIYKDNEFKLYKEKETFIYNDEDNYFLQLDNTIIGFIDDLMAGLNKDMVGLEEVFEKRKFSLIPKKEEGYIFIDEASLVNLEHQKGKTK